MREKIDFYLPIRNGFKDKLLPKKPYYNFVVDYLRKEGDSVGQGDRQKGNNLGIRLKLSQGEEVVSSAKIEGAGYAVKAGICGCEEYLNLFMRVRAGSKLQLKLFEGSFKRAFKRKFGK